MMAYKFRPNLIYIIIISGLTLALIFTARRCNHVRSLRNISDNNASAFAAMYESYKDKYGRSAMRVQSLELTESSLISLVNSKEEYIRGLSLEVSRLSSKIKRLETAIHITATTSGSVTVIQLDSFIRDTVKTVMDYASYKDEWLELSLFKHDDSDSVDVLYSVKSPIFAVIYKDRPLKINGDRYKIPVRWFKGWTYFMEAKCLNPNSVVESAGVVKIVKRGRK